MINPYVSYKGYFIEDNSTRWGGKQFSIYNGLGFWIENCKSKKACKEIIDKLVDN